MWILFAYGSAFFAGITAIIAKKGIKNVDSNVATAVRTIVILIFSWLMVFIVGSQNTIGTIQSKTLLFLILSGFATGASWLCYFRALQLGDVTKVTPIDKSSTIMTMILALIILGESITVLKIISMIAIGLGTYLMIQQKPAGQKSTEEKSAEQKPGEKKFKENHEIKLNKKNSWFFYAMLSAVFASLTSVLGKIGIQDIESNLGTAIRTVVVLIMAWLVVFAFRKQKEVRSIDKSSAIYLCLSGLTTGLSWLCYYKALQKGDASIVVPIDKLSILVTVLFSYIFLKEGIRKIAVLGLLILVGGTLLLLVK